jgi:hypothetical protein
MRCSSIRDTSSGARRSTRNLLTAARSCSSVPENSSRSFRSGGGCFSVHRGSIDPLWATGSMLIGCCSSIGHRNSGHVRTSRGLFTAA